MTTKDILLYTALIVVLPILPALVIYRIVPPPETTASGPFAKLNLKLTGSFAAYFIVALLASGFILKMLTSQERQKAGEEAAYDVWTVEGRLSFPGIDEADLAPMVNNAQILLRPPLPDPPLGAGRFRVRGITLPRKPSRADYPSLSVMAEGYTHVSVPLLPSELAAPGGWKADVPVDFDSANKLITIGDSILMQPISRQYPFDRFASTQR